MVHLQTRCVGLTLKEVLELECPVHGIMAGCLLRSAEIGRVRLSPKVRDSRPRLFAMQGAGTRMSKGSLVLDEEVCGRTQGQTRRCPPVSDIQEFVQSLVFPDDWTPAAWEDPGWRPFGAQGHGTARDSPSPRAGWVQKSRRPQREACHPFPADALI